MRLTWKHLKPFLRWFILSAVLFFLAKTLRDHWQEVSAIQMQPAGYGWLAIALLITLLAHICTGWVWSWILQSLNQPARGAWAVRVYLKTNIAKYLPGNVWHFYGRISAATKIGVSTEAALVSVVLEPLLMVAAALLIALTSLQQPGMTQIRATQLGPIQALPTILLVSVLVSLHPRFLNPILAQLLKLKGSATKSQTEQILRLKHYPWRSLLGEAGFLLLRSLGFCLTFRAIAPIAFEQIPLIVGSFVVAWLSGFVTPGLPGGVGVFEAVAIALLSRGFPAADLLSGVAIYRLLNTLAEGLGAGLAQGSDR
jgi:glycosyltransferase 2 family protein